MSACVTAAWSSSGPNRALRAAPGETSRNPPHLTELPADRHARSADQGALKARKTYAAPIRPPNPHPGPTGITNHQNPRRLMRASSPQQKHRRPAAAPLFKDYAEPGMLSSRGSALNANRQSTLNPFHVLTPLFSAMNMMASVAAKNGLKVLTQT